MTNNQNTEEQLDFFFWLGIDGVAEPVDDIETFNQKIEDERERFQRWLMVELMEGDPAEEVGNN